MRADDSISCKNIDPVGHQVVVLAAGLGRRLGEVTKDITKAMVQVAGKTLVERMITQLSKYPVERYVFVVGHQGQKLIDHIGHTLNGREVIYIWNDKYDVTNNIYSLWLASSYLEEFDTVLLESDLILDDKIIQLLFDCSHPNAALLSRLESWMDGSLVTLDDSGMVKSFIKPEKINLDRIETYYKTLNAYKFSKNFLKECYLPFLNAYSTYAGVNKYYEEVLSVLLESGFANIYGLDVGNLNWYEIDNVDDLRNAEVLFSDSHMQYNLMANRWGGYWRFPNVLDCSLLVNPFFPTKCLLEEVKAYLSSFITSYPSAASELSHLASRIFSIDPDSICVANGASEIISILPHVFPRKKFLVYTPTFNEYVSRFKSENLNQVFLTVDEFYNLEFRDIVADATNDDGVILVSPGNPIPCSVSLPTIISIAHELASQRKFLIVDESFSDFKNCNLNSTLLNSDFSKLPDNLIVIKSLGKSFGVPGLRLGVLAANEEIVAKVKSFLPVWNINSIAEFFLQSFEKYKPDYLMSLIQIENERLWLIENISRIRNIHVYPSDANFIVIRIATHNPDLIVCELLQKHKILVKSLSNKKGDDFGSLIRIAVSSRPNNVRLLTALNDILQVVSANGYA